MLERKNKKMMKKIVMMTILMFGLFFMGASQMAAQSRIFPLYLQNGTDEDLNLKITWADGCYEGSPGMNAVIGPIAPGGKGVITIARVQGNGCDGKGATFCIQSTNPRHFDKDNPQCMTFSNDGQLWLSHFSSKKYSSTLSSKNPDPADQSYTLTIKDFIARDPAFYTPKNNIANDSGNWGPSSKIDALAFVPNPGMWGNFYDDCVGIELFHPQHVVRLANKNGLAYFVVAQSRAHNGWISVLETDPGVLNQSTDLLTPQGNAVAGHYIWNDVYTGVKNGVINPVGNWNHPGKMEVIGDVLIVAAQNWSPGGVCQYAPGTTEDQVLFYDVRDPRKPVYIGNMTASQLGVKEISLVGIIRAPNGDYLITAGGDGTYTTRMARKVSPNINDWELVSSGSFGGQHGMMFNSYQKTSNLGSLPAGTERIMYFDSEDRNKLAFNEYSYEAATRGLKPEGSAKYPYQLPGANRDWDSDSLYVSPNGSTTIYSMESATGSNGILYQLSNPATSTPRGSTVYTGCGFTYKTKSARDTQCGAGGTSIWIGDGVDESKMTRGQVVYTGCGYTYASKAARDTQCGSGEETSMWIPE